MIEDLRAADALLFDLDGVLLDTERLYTEATQTIVGRFGKKFDFALKKHLMGRDARVSAQVLLERLEIPMSPEEFLNERAPVLDALLEQSPVMPGAEEFVSRMAKHGKKMAVATSSGRRLYELKVRPHGFFGLFGAVVCGDDPRVGAKKPSPDIFLVAAEALGVVPTRCVVFEDSLAGLEAGIAAGMRVVALPDPAMDPGEFHGAYRIATRHWTEILRSLDSAPVAVQDS
jgi:pseudouridine-5'-monophosphatase